MIKKRNVFILYTLFLPCKTRGCV